MQRPPDRKSPQVLFSRSANEWINRIAQMLKQFTELGLSEEEKAYLERWLETEFACSTLISDEGYASHDEVARMAAQASEGASATSEPDATVFAHLQAIRKIMKMAETTGRAALLTPQLLISLNEVITGESGFRKTQGDTGRALKPVSAESLPAAVESACLWYTAESFAELNPVEQASIILLRLVEIQPFERANLQTALVAASLFTVRSGLPPVVMRPEQDAAFQSALEEGSRTNTKPMVELIAAVIEKTLGEMIGVIENKRLKAKGRKR